MKFLETQPVRDKNVKKRDVLESVMFLIRPLRRVRKNHGLGTSRAPYQRKPRL